MNTINVTIVTSRDCNSPEIQQLLDVSNYLSARVRNQVNIESRCMHLGNYQLEIGIFIDGNLIQQNNLAGLVDYLHMRLLNQAIA